MKKRNGKSIGNNGVGSNQSGLKNNLQEHAPKGRAYPEVALCGNPNCGKTSLFNCLTGGHQHVGNWGGVTVELKQGRSRIAGEVVTIVDLPGTYSLSAFSMEERVARDFILEEKPDVVIDVIDTSNLERNLYLTVQLMELGVRPVLAFNMWDEVEQKGLRIDLPLLSKLLDLPIVTTVGKTGANAGALLKKAVEVGQSGKTTYTKPLPHLPMEIERAIDVLASHDALQKVPFPVRWSAMKLLENDPQVVEVVQEVEKGTDTLKRTQQFIQEIQSVLGEDPESLIAEARYGFIAGALRQTVKKNTVKRVEVSDSIDKILTHQIWAYPIFFLFMWLLFQATFVLGAYPMEWIEATFTFVGKLTSNILPPGHVHDLVVDGIVGGVGGVAVFLPNILILFLGIAVMEDTGYMARAAFIMDKIMHKVGLHGKSFIPLVMGMGCNVPAIMAARTLESPRDRIKTILLAPLISCSARLPVYVLFAGALFPKHAGNIVFLFQFIFGTVMFFVMAWVFRKTLFRGEDYPFVMELPPYRLPTARSVVIHMWQRVQHYIKKMGGVVLLFSIIIWGLSTFPENNDVKSSYEQQIESVRTTTVLSEGQKASTIDSLRTQMQSEVTSRTYIGQIGKTIEPVFRPLGYDWRGAVSLLTGFVAKEIVVSSMGVLYAVGEESDQTNEELRTEISSHFSPLAGFSFMLFVLLYTPCIVALVTVIRELKNIKWSLFSLGYQLVLAWSMAFLVYQGGRLLGLE